MASLTDFLSQETLVALFVGLVVGLLTYFAASKVKWPW